LAERRPSLLIDLLANYGDSALIALEAALGGDNRLTSVSKMGPSASVGVA
jgi:hypothetical protein